MLIIWNWTVPIKLSDVVDKNVKKSEYSQLKSKVARLELKTPSTSTSIYNDQSRIEIMIFHASKHFLILITIVLNGFQQLHEDEEGVHFKNTTLLWEH